MYFGFALDASDIDLRDIDFLDTDLDLLDTDIPSKYFVYLQDVLKTSWRRLEDQQMFAPRVFANVYSAAVDIHRFSNFIYL